MPNRSRDWCVECESRQWGGSVDHPEHLPPEGGSPFRGVSVDPKDTHTSRRRTTRGRIVEGGPESIPQLTVVLEATLAPSEITFVAVPV